MAKTRHAAGGASSSSSTEARPIQEVWAEYKKTGSEHLRNTLMEHYLPLVKYNAERIHAKLPDEVDVEDLMSAGIFGLMDAIEAFDLERGVKFETYCAPRIRGAILDELRSMDWVPRLVRSRSSQVDQARKSLQMELGRTPTDEELAKKIGVNQEEFAKIRKDAGAVGIVSLSRKWFETDSNKDIREIDVLEDARQVNPLSAVSKRDLKELITKGLSRAERLIVILYYYEEMTMKEIGMTLDLSESRVSQMHSSILARLKAQLQHRSKELQAEAE
ncbi:MAG TPA: FliA/WhiG family RNA polymerase sigma factor [Phycisphaeraceae bacterium]